MKDGQKLHRKWKEDQQSVLTNIKNMAETIVDKMHISTYQNPKRSAPGMQQGGVGMQQGGVGMQQGGVGIQQGGPGRRGLQQGIVGMNQGRLGIQHGGFGVQQGVNQGGYMGFHQPFSSHDLWEYFQNR